MAWENKIVGFEIKKFGNNDIIPADAKHLHSERVFDGMAGWISNLQPVYKMVHHYQVPIYKKIRTKKAA